MSIQNILLVILAGTAAGFLNIMAGGGSLITLPLLISMGMPSALANGTNRIALMMQNIVGISNFKNKGYSNYKLSIMLAIPAVVGSIIGARLAISLPDDIFNKILAFIMIVMLFLILFNPIKKYKKVKENLSLKNKITAGISFFFIGIYGGFIHAGVGIIIIATLTLITGFSLVKINSIKVFTVAIYLLSSLFIFIFSGNVNWVVGFFLGIGNSLGAWIGSTLAVSRGDNLIKIVLAVAVIMMAGNLLGIY